MWVPIVVGGVVFLLARRGGAIDDESPTFSAFPVDGCVDGVCTSSQYGFRHSPITGKASCHRGIDFARPSGTPIRSVADGTVTYSGSTPVGGKTVIVDHGDGIHSHYLHMSQRLVGPGDEVDAGDQIGKVGTTGRSTGPHLHFAIRVDGLYLDPGPLLGLPSGPPC